MARMGFWDWLDSRAERKFLQRADLVERGLDARSMFAAFGRTFDARLLIAGSIIALFAVAFLREADKDTRNLMVGALIAAFAGAWGYYLGSSSSSAKNQDTTDKALQLSHDAVKALPPPPQALPDPVDEAAARAQGAAQAAGAAGEEADALAAQAHQGEGTQR